MFHQTHSASQSTLSIAQRQFAMGERCIEADQYHLAIVYLRKAIKHSQHPLNREETASAFDALGYAYDQLGDYDRAITCYDNAIRLNPEIPAFYLHRGFIELEKNNYTMAYDDLSTCLDADPNNLSARALRSDAARHIGSSVMVLDVTKEETMIEGDEAEGYLVQSIKDATTVIEQGSHDYPEAFLIRACAYMDHYFLVSPFTRSDLTRNLGLAISDFTKAEEREVLHATDLFNKAIMLYHKETLFKAIRLLPNDLSLPLLKLSLQENTTLGKRFWEQEGFRACSLERGTLKQICEAIAEIESKVTTGVRLFSQPTNKKQVDLNPVTVDNIFQL